MLVGIVGVPVNEPYAKSCAVPVIVNVSPDTAVVMFVPPAILNVSPGFTAVPDESSPTNVVANDVVASVPSSNLALLYVLATFIEKSSYLTINQILLYMMIKT